MFLSRIHPFLLSHSSVHWRQCTTEVQPQPSSSMTSRKRSVSVDCRGDKRCIHTPVHSCNISGILQQSENKRTRSRQAPRCDHACDENAKNRPFELFTFLKIKPKASFGPYIVNVYRTLSLLAFRSEPAAGSRADHIFDN